MSERITDERLAELRETAMRAGKTAPGEWDSAAIPATRHEPEHVCVAAGGHDVQIRGREGSSFVGWHIEAFDPPTVLALLDEIERLRGLADDPEAIERAARVIAYSAPFDYKTTARAAISAALQEAIGESDE